MRALLGKVDPRRIVSGYVAINAQGCVGVLELRRDRDVLFRCAKNIALLDEHIMSEHDHHVVLAEVALSRCAAQSVESATVRWNRELGRLYHNPSQCGISCAIEIWIPSQSGEPLVAQLRLFLEGTRCERNEQYGLVGNLDFWPAERSLHDNPFYLKVTSCRPDFFAEGISSAVVAKALLMCSVRNQTDRLLHFFP